MLDSEVPLSELPILGVAGATHFVMGLENRLENGLDLGIEGYFKSFDDLPDAENLFSSGADIWVQAREGPVRGWIGYSLAWVWTNDPDEDTGFVGRQLLSGGLSTDLRGFDIGLRLTYGAGLPFTSVSTTPAGDTSPATPQRGDNADPVPTLSGAPEDSYLRVDAEISRRIVTSVGDSRLEIAPYIRFLNALDRRDALFYEAGTTDALTRPAPLATVPIIAVLGVAFAF